MTKPLTILHTESSCGWGGQEIRILTEAVGMQALGHHVLLACPHQAPIYQAAQELGLPVQALPIERKSLHGLRALGQWLNTQSIDMINTHSSTDSWLVALARAFNYYQGAVVRTRHVSALINSNLATRWLYTKGCDFVITTGERLRQHVIDATGLDSSRTQSIPTGIDLNQFKVGDKAPARLACGLPQDKVIIGIVATLRSWKGHQYLIEAIAQLNRPDILVLIVGEGPNRSNIETSTAINRLTDQVYFAGNQTNVTLWLQVMDLFVLPSYANEGVPQSLMQAMACGIPVVSTPVGSIDELVEDKVTGRLVAPKSSSALAEVINELLHNQAQCKQLAQRALKRVQTTYAQPIMVNQMQMVFEKVVRC